MPAKKSLIQSWQGIVYITYLASDDFCDNSVSPLSFSNKFSLDIQLYLSYGDLLENRSGKAPRYNVKPKFTYKGE
jgi:hypothetical protein